MVFRLLLLFLLPFYSTSAFAFSVHKWAVDAGIAVGIVAAEKAVETLLESEGIQRWLYDNGVYVDEATGEMWYNTGAYGPNQPNKCYYFFHPHYDAANLIKNPLQKYPTAHAACEGKQDKAGYPGPSSNLRNISRDTNNYCLFCPQDAHYCSYQDNVYRVSYVHKRCPTQDEDNCKPFDDFESLDDDSYEYDESDAPFWERVKSRLSPDKGAELDDYLKKKKGKKKKRKRKKKHDIDEEDDSACGKEFKKKGKKRKKPKDDDDEEDEEKDDKDDKDDDKDKDDKDKDDKDKDDKDKKKKDKDDDGDKDDDDKDDKEKDDKDKKKKKDDDCSICELRKDLKKYDEEERGYRKEILKELRKRNDDDFNRKEPELPKVKDKDYTQSKRINIEGRCPKPYILDLKVGKVEFKYDLICRYAELMRYFVLASAALMSAYILLGVARHG